MPEIIKTNSITFCSYAFTCDIPSAILIYSNNNNKKSFNIYWINLKFSTRFWRRLFWNLLNQNKRTLSLNYSNTHTSAKMSPKQWLALFCFYISYLLFGASIFYHIERDLEVNNYAIELQRRIDVNGKLKQWRHKKITDSNTFD